MKIVFILIITVNVFFGIIQYHRIRVNYIRWFVPFLTITLFAEVAAFFNWINIEGSNHWWYNIYTAIEFLFFSYVFKEAIEKRSLKKIIKISTWFFLMAFIINIVWGQGWNHFHTITYRLGSLMIICWCFFYFRELIYSDEVKTPLINPMFWISTGLLFFFIGFFVYINVFDFIAYSKIKEYSSLFKFISNFLNVLFYSCIFIGIYFSWQTKT
jgi:hypothetical protein